MIQPFPILQLSLTFPLNQGHMDKNLTRIGRRLMHLAMNKCNNLIPFVLNCSLCFKTDLNILLGKFLCPLPAKAHLPSHCGRYEDQMSLVENLSSTQFTSLAIRAQIAILVLYYNLLKEMEYYFTNA